MDLAILAPAALQPSDSTTEDIWRPLQAYINAHSSHVCRLVQPASHGSDLAALLDGCRRHAAIDLRSFDRLLTGQAPAWLNAHPQHNLYLLQRPFADRFPAPTMGGSAASQAIADFNLALPSGNSRLFQLLDRLSAELDAGRLHESQMGRGGPLATQLVQVLERYALQPARIRTSAATSAAWAGARPTLVLHPPPRLGGLRCDGDDHLLAIGPLSASARIDLLIEAMRGVRAGIELLVAGTGPDEQRLRTLAAGDRRIRFLGQPDDETLRRAYGDALAVSLVAPDTVYSIATVEAMRSGKPVLTVHDAGAPTGLVRHGETGLCVAPTAAALAAAIESLCADRQATRAMGGAARRSVAALDWRPLVEHVLGPAARTGSARAPGLRSPRRQRPKAVVALSFGVTPPRGGGQSRVFHLYRRLAKHMDITLLCLCEANDVERQHPIVPGLTEIRVPKSAEHQRQEAAASHRVGDVPVTDIVAATLIHHTPRFVARLDEAAADADVLVASHPYFASLLRTRRPDLPLWFEAHNVELLLKRAILPAGPAADDLLRLVEDGEGLAWRKASVVYACSARDLEVLRDLYGASGASTFEVPNGYAEDEVPYTCGLARASLKRLLGLGDRPLVIFLGSWHGPNLEAAERLVDYAQALPQVMFAVVGSAADYLRGRSLPDNLRRVGSVDEEEKKILLGAATLALNPMTSGSGTNLKMLDYFGAGLPVLSTPFGARGLPAVAGEHFIESDIDHFLPTLADLLAQPALTEGLSERAHALAQSCCSWRSIGDAAWSRLATEIGRGRP